METKLNLESYPESLPDGTTFEMIKVKKGTFLMGSDEDSREKPIHAVTVSSFFLGRIPVTQAIWQSVMGENPSNFKGLNRPVERVSWYDTQVFLKKLNALTGKTFRLPSEAEWEYAARGGKYVSVKNKGLRYAGGNKLKEVGWYHVNSHRETKPLNIALPGSEKMVDLKLPNTLGLYDMNGNVWEWCADRWHDDYNGAPDDGSAWTTGGYADRRVVRGGSWDSYDSDARVSFRNWDDTNDRDSVIGFRLARS